MMDNLYLITFGIGLAFCGLWRLRCPARGFVCARQQKVRSRR